MKKRSQGRGAYKAGRLIVAGGHAWLRACRGKPAGREEAGGVNDLRGGG